MKKVCVALVLIVVMSVFFATAAYAGSVTIDIGNPGTGAGYTFSDSNVTITAPGDYTITGNTIHNSLTVAGDIEGAVNLTLSGLSIRMADDRCPFSIGQNSSVNLILVGANTIDPTNEYRANKRGISTSSGVSLTISGEGSLSVKGQSAAEAIGAEGNITISSGTVVAFGGYSEGQSGKSGIRGASITINGGSVTAKGGHGYGMASSGLGAGSITINGGEVIAEAGTSDYIGSGAGIGGGANDGGGTIVINGGHVTATGGGRGAGIGGGSSGSGGNITISGGTVIANGGADAAGIGGGYRGGGGTITITNQNGNTHVTATGLNGGAGIGGGYQAGYVGGNGGTITISGGTIQAVGGSNGSAGIGSGNYGGNGGHITISGGTVDATGGYKAAGIGGGEYFSGGTINITGGEVTANGGDQGAGIGSGNNTSGAAVNGGAITILGGTVNAMGGVGGAGIGGGFDADGGTVSITGAAVTATGRGGGAGIGGGPNSTQWGNGGTIALSSGSVMAISHGGGAGIGGGWMGNAGNIIITGGLVTASADDRAPGIGSGGGSVYKTQGTNSVTINAGRVYAMGSGNSDIGGDGNMSYRTTNTFNGGSIRADSVNFSPKTGTADVYKTTVTVTNADGSALADTDVAYSINGGESTSTATDRSGKLYLWLPQTSGGGSTHILVSKGTTEYAASGQVTNDNAAVMTAIEKTYEIGAISDQTLADLSEGYVSGSQVLGTIRVTNTGTAALSNLSVSLETGKEVYFELDVPSAAEIPAGGHLDFTIKAKDALVVGDYSAAITVQADKASDISFTVSQKVKMLLIAFINNGETYAEGSIHYNTSIGEGGWPADPTKTGYTFSGWYTQANIRAIPSTVFTQPTSLNAKWTANTYKVTFEAQEGTVSPQDKTVTYDETYGVLPTPFKRGYTFGGWYTEAGGMGQLITSSNTVKINSDITLYAKWTAKTVSATISPSSRTFDKSTAHQADVTTAITWNDAAQVTDVKTGNVSIGKSNYGVSGNTLTVKKDYLKTRAVGDLVLAVVFDECNPAMLTIAISDTTPVTPAPNDPTPIQVAISCTKTDVRLFGGSDGTVTISASGGNSGTYEYSINDGSSWQASNVFSGLGAGAYTAAVRDAGNPSNIAKCSVSISQPPHTGNVPANKVPPTANAGTAVTVNPPAAPKGATITSVSYSTTNPSVATVDSRGNVTFLTGGKVTIITTVVSQTTDKSGKVKTKTTTVKKTIIVKQPVASITLNMNNATIARKANVKLIPSIAPGTASNKKLKWTSSNPKIASVSSSGVVTGKAGGTAIITCTAKDGSGACASCTITVTPIYPSGVKLSKAVLTVKMGKTASFKATIAPKNTDFKTVTWTSSNLGVVVVDAKGKVRAVAPGTATITATTAYGQTASCIVTVQ